MATARQRLRIVSLRNRRGQSSKRGIFINRQSIGTIYINGVPYSYNLDLVYNEYTSIDDIYSDYLAMQASSHKKKVIVVKRK